MNEIRNECIRRGYGIPPILNDFKSAQEQFDKVWFKYHLTLEILNEKYITVDVLYKENHQLRKALDKACDYLDYGYNSLDDDKHEFNKEEWKEYLMNNCENQ